ncbi:MAG: ribulose-phosphate 3-epimerase [Nitrospirae bacterium]|nr:ribulose-phosphate 3-epimerase [Nitrospirota bacterium]
MALISPSILSADFMNLKEEIEATERAGADMLHVDVMDGLFVPNITIGFFVVEQIKKITALPLDVHLMIDSPDRYVRDFISAGANVLTIHYEADRHLHRTINWIKELGARAGVSINPATPVSTLANIIGDVDLLVLMSVNPGFGGQHFIPSSIDKLKSLREMSRGTNALIEIDGGINVNNAPLVVEAGADILVMGSAFYKPRDYVNTVKKIKAIAGGRNGFAN